MSSLSVLQDVATEGQTTSPTCDWYQEWIVPNHRLNRDPLGMDRREDFYEFCRDRGLLYESSVTELALQVYAVMAEKFGSDYFLDNAEYVDDWLCSYEHHKTWFPEWLADEPYGEGCYYSDVSGGEEWSGVPSYEPPSLSKTSE